MKLLIVNEVCGHTSTGKICTQIADNYLAKGYEVKIAYGRDAYVPDKYRKYAVRIGNGIDVRLHAIETRLFDAHGFGSRRATRKFLIWAEQYKPDMVWLHNLHGYYINIELLFEWIKKQPHLKVKWTLHDCWAFTGHCSHFMAVECEKWKEQCEHCVQKKQYPKSIGMDRSASNYDRKKECFQGVEDMTIITPSKWLAKMVSQSILKEYPVEIVHNTIDTSVFKPIESNFRKQYGLENKKVILGVANVWNERKGLLDFFQLMQSLDESYAIVLVGLTSLQIKSIPKIIKGMHMVSRTQGYIMYHSDYALETANGDTTDGIERNGVGCAIEPDIRELYKSITGEHDMKINDTMTVSCLVCIPRTKSVEELVELYSMADLFVNPTHEDNYPTVNLEARACGTYVITYDVGGCKETLQ